MWDKKQQHMRHYSCTGPVYRFELPSERVLELHEHGTFTSKYIPRASILYYHRLWIPRDAFQVRIVPEWCQGAKKSVLPLVWLHNRPWQADLINITSAWKTIWLISGHTFSSLFFQSAHRDVPTWVKSPPVCAHRECPDLGKEPSSMCSSEMTRIVE